MDSEGEQLGPTPVAVPGGYGYNNGAYKSVSNGYNGYGYAGYSGATSTPGSLGMTSRQYTNVILAKVTSRLAWGIFWAIMALFSLAVFAAACATPKYNEVNFAIVVGLFNTIISVTFAVLFLQPGGSLQERVSGLWLNLFKTERNRKLGLVGFLTVHFIFWLALSAAYRWVPLLCYAAISFCGAAQATLAFAILAFFGSFWALVFGALDTI